MGTLRAIGVSTLIRSIVFASTLAACGGGGGANQSQANQEQRIGTLAYVVTECSKGPDGVFFARQSFRIRQGDRPPITVMETPRVTGNALLEVFCPLLGLSRNGQAAVVAGVFERLAVSPDGSTVAFRSPTTSRS